MRKLYTYFGIIISILILYILLSMVNLNYALNLISNVSFKTLIICFFVFFISLIFLTLQFRLVLHKIIPFRDMFFISSAHFMFNSTLPARTGEFSYFYFLKNRNISLSKGIATLTAVRIFDIFALMILLIFSVLTIFSEVPEFVKLLIIILIILLLLACLFYILISKFQFFLFREYSNKLIKKIVIYLNKILNDFKEINLRRIWFLLLLYSLLRWLTNYSIYFLILKDLNLHLSVGLILIASIVPILTTFLPIQGIAGFGTREAVWTIILIAVSIPRQLAILSGFIIHIVLIIYILIFGFISIIYILLKNKLTLIKFIKSSVF